MNIKHPVFFALLTTACIVQTTHSSIKKFTQHHEKPSLPETVSFLQFNHLNDNLCNKIVYEFTVKKKHAYLAEHFNLFISQLANIVDECKLAEENKSTDWIKHFGFPIKDTIEVKHDVIKSGIAGDLEVSLDPKNGSNRATIRLILTKKDNYDQAVWLKIFNIAIRYTELLEDLSNKDNPEDTLRKFGFPFDSILYNKELETSLSITFDKSPSHLTVGFTQT